MQEEAKNQAISLYREANQLIYNAKDYKAAIAKCNQALDICKKYSFKTRDFYLKRGYAFSKALQHRLAIKDYEDANLDADDPKNATEFNNMGNVYYELKDYQAAIDCYSRVIKLKPDSALAFRNRANVFFHMGEIENFKKDFQQAVKIDPELPTRDTKLIKRYLEHSAGDTSVAELMVKRRRIIAESSAGATDETPVRKSKSQHTVRFAT